MSLEKEFVCGSCGATGADEWSMLCDPCDVVDSFGRSARMYQESMAASIHHKAMAETYREEMESAIAEVGEMLVGDFKYFYRKPHTREVWDKDALNGFAEADDKLASLRETVITHKWSAKALKQVKGYALARPEIMEMKEVVPVAGSLVIKAVKS